MNGAASRSWLKGDIQLAAISAPKNQHDVIEIRIVLLQWYVDSLHGVESLLNRDSAEESPSLGWACIGQPLTTKMYVPAYRINTLRQGKLPHINCGVWIRPDPAVNTPGTHAKVTS